MVSRIMMIVSQNENERTIICLESTIKQGHIPAKAPLGYKYIDKKLVPNPLTNDIIIKLYNSYFEGLSYNTIAKLFNKEKDDGFQLKLSPLNKRFIRIIT